MIGKTIYIIDKIEGKDKDYKIEKALVQMCRKNNHTRSKKNRQCKGVIIKIGIKIQFHEAK